MAKRIKAVWIEIHVHPSAIEENHSFPVFVRHRSCRGDCILYAGVGPSGYVSAWIGTILVLTIWGLLKYERNK